MNPDPWGLAGDQDFGFADLKDRPWAQWEALANRAGSDFRQKCLNFLNHFTFMAPGLKNARECLHLGL